MIFTVFKEWRRRVVASRFPINGSNASTRMATRPELVRLQYFRRLKKLI